MAELRISHRRTSTYVPASLLLVVLAFPSLLLADRNCPKPGHRQGGIMISPYQAGKLVPVFEQACQLRADHYLQMAELNLKMLEAFRAFRDEDEKDQGFSKEVERNAAVMSHRAKTVGEKFTTEMLELEQEVKSILTPDQLRYIDNMEQTQPRRGPEEMIRHIEHGRMKEFGANTDSRVGKILEEMHQLGDSIHPHTTVISRRFLNPDNAQELYYLAGARASRETMQAIGVIKQGTREYPKNRYEAESKEVGRLRGEINIWNLVNGLHLTRKQADTIVKCAQSAQVMRDQFKYPMGSQWRM